MPGPAFQQPILNAFIFYFLGGCIRRRAGGAAGGLPLMKRCLISEKPWSFAKKLGAVTISIDRQFWTHFPAIFFSYRYYYILHLYNSTGFFPSSFFSSFAFVVRCIWQKPPSMPMPWRGSIPLSFSTFSRFYRNNLTPYKISLLLLLLLLLLCPRITESEQGFFFPTWKKKAIHANYNRKKKKGAVRNGSGVTTCRTLHNRRLIWSQSISREREKLHERLSPGRGPIMLLLGL